MQIAVSNQPDRLERPGTIARLVDHDIGENEISRALDRIHIYVDRIINEPASVGRVFVSRELDLACVAIGNAAAKAYIAESEGGGRKGTSFLLSRLVNAGGHIEVMKDIIRLGLLPPPYTVVVTDCFEAPDDEAHRRFREALGVEVIKIEARDSAERLEKTLDSLLERNCAVLVILTHNQDSVGIAAAVACSSYEKFYIHHGDHHLSLGVTLLEFVHVDLFNHSFFQCRTVHGQPNNRLWPLTTPDVGFTPRYSFFTGGAIVTAICGRPEKFEAGDYRFDYFEIIPRVLEAGGGRHIHIGELSTENLNRVYFALEEKGIPLDRFKHIPWVPSLARSLVENRVDLYMSSFPHGGGKAVIEAMSVGTPLLLHSNYRSRFLGSGDVGYPEAQIWLNEGALLRAVSAFTPNDAARHSALARQHFTRFHSESALVRAMEATGSKKLDLVPPLSDYISDPLEAFVEEQNSTPSELRKLRETLNMTREHERVLHREYLRVLNAYNEKVSILDAFNQELEKLRRDHDASVSAQHKLAHKTRDTKTRSEASSAKLPNRWRQRILSRLFGKKR